MTSPLLPPKFELTHLQSVPRHVEFTVAPPTDLVSKFSTITSRSRAAAVLDDFTSVYPSIFDGLETLLVTFNPSYQDPVDSEMIFTPRGVSSDVQSGNFHTDGVRGRGRRLFVSLRRLQKALSNIHLFTYLKELDAFEFPNAGERYSALEQIEKLRPYLVSRYNSCLLSYIYAFSQLFLKSDIIGKPRCPLLAELIIVCLQQFYTFIVNSLGMLPKSDWFVDEKLASLVMVRFQFVAGVFSTNNVFLARLCC